MTIFIWNNYLYTYTQLYRPYFKPTLNLLCIPTSKSIFMIMTMGLYSAILVTKLFPFDWKTNNCIHYFEVIKTYKLKTLNDRLYIST